MNHPRRRLRPAHLGLALLPLALSQAFAAPLTASWLASGGGSYGSAANWDIGVVPVNGGGNTFAVQIAGANHAVGYTLTGMQAIDAFALDAGSSFNLSSTSFILPTDLTVKGRAIIAGAITADNASFTALGTGTNFAGSSASVSATNGGVVRIAATSYNARGLAGSTFLHASGAGSLIDLSSLASIDTAQGSGYSESVVAEDSATIDLSGVRSLVAPSVNGPALAFSVTSGATLDLGNLQTISGPTTDSGKTSFTIDGASATLGAIRSANQLSVTLKGGATATMGGYAGTAELTNASFAVLAGSTLDASRLVGTLTDRGLGGSTVISATGSGSFLDLSGLQSIDVAQGSGYSNAISVSDKARLDLSGVKSLVAPSVHGPVLAFSVTSGANLDMSGLQTVSGPTTDSGGTSFTLDGASARLGAIQSANQMSITLKGASTMTIGGYAGTARLTNTTFYAEAGSTLDASTLAGTLIDRGLGGSPLITATGAQSFLDLSGLQSIDVAQGSGYSNYVNVSDKAKVDLSGVKTLVAPAVHGPVLAFSVTGGASLDMSGLQTISGPTTDSGGTSFTLDGATATLGAIQSANQMAITLKGASVLTVGGFAGTAALTNSTFYAEGGSTLAAAQLGGTLTDRGLGGANLITATGAGTFADLSGLQSIDVAQGSGYSNYVNVSDRARLALSGVTTLVAPSVNGASLTFAAQSGGHLDLGSLQTVSGPTIGSGRTTFAFDGASGVVGPLQKANEMVVDLKNGSTLGMGGYAGTAALTDSTFSVAGGSRLSAGKLVGTLADRGLGGQTLIGVTGAGSAADLSGLRSIDAGTGSGYSEYVSVSDKATLDLSGLRSVVAPSANGAALAFAASGGGHLDLSSLQAITNPGGGLVTFSVSTGGSLTLHGMAAGPAARFNLTDAGSTLSVLGNLSLLAGSTLSAGAGTTIQVGGNFSFAQTVESQMNLDAATLAFGGQALHTVEIGGERGATLATGKAVTNDFAIGQLDVGKAGTASTVELVDLVDNGNRHSPEVLYLNGVGGGDGLSILGGSTLELNGLDVYAYEAGRWEHLNELFKPGVTKVAFDQGYIVAGVTAVPEPGSLAMLAAGLAVVGLRAGRRR